VADKLQPCTTARSESAARLVFGLSRSNHITPTLIQLHWLPVSYRIKFKRWCLVHAIHYDPATWNALPDLIRTVADPVKFRKLLKSHYFSQAFNAC